MKPLDVFDREVEWMDLERSVTSTQRGVRVGVVYGRRRLGKSYLLRRLCREHHGLYHVALEEEPSPALQRFADTVALSRGLNRGQLRFADWDEALRAALAGPERLVVLDELPYLLAHSPGRSIPSVLQTIVDESRDRRGPAKRVIVCGSALAVMSEILSGTKALRGRADLDLLLRPFDVRTTAAFYGVDDPLVAFRLFAVFGGVPGYRDLLGDPSPQTTAELEELILATVCNPSHALFSEPAYLLREDPRVTDRALYFSILDAVAAGASTPTKIAARIGRAAASMAHPLDVLVSAGFLRKDDDVLLQRRPSLRVADPIVRFHDLVVAPRLAAFEDRRAAPALADADATIRSQVYGPAFEAAAREWVSRHADAVTVGGRAGEVGTTVVNDRYGRARHEVDVVVLPEGQRRQSAGATVLAIGEAKDSDRRRTVSDLTRLERIRAALVANAYDAATAKLLLFGRAGFDTDLRSAARARHDIELVDLERMLTGV